METPLQAVDAQRHAGAPALQDWSPDALVRDSRARIFRRLGGREQLVSLALGALVLLAVGAVAATVDDGRAFSPIDLVLLVLLYAAVSRVEYEVGAGIAVPTQLVFVPMLFLLPIGIVPLCVALGLLIGAVVDRARRGAPLIGALGVLVSAAYAVGPVLVLHFADAHEPRLDHIVIYVAALAAQFGIDFGASTTRERLVLGLSPRDLAPYMVFVYAVDIALACVGLSVAIVASVSPAAILLPLPLIGLLAYFARERQARIDHALELSHAYRGTALLLGDVVEADDDYTGLHSREVLVLVVTVTGELDLDARARQRTELAALLHDVGKIRIPKEIVNKPGKLDDAERAIVETHTIEGERMLQNVGGLLAEVGRIVRSCHEHWDGAGYPDRLVGEAIPIEARIVGACDAFNAMTTDRPYRAACTVGDALAEMWRCAGTQFDPRVVQALAHVAVSADGRLAGG